MGSPSRNVQYHPPRLSEDRLNLAQPHSPSLPTHCSGKSGMRPFVEGCRGPQLVFGEQLSDVDDPAVLELSEPRQVFVDRVVVLQVLLLPVGSAFAVVAEVGEQNAFDPCGVVADGQDAAFGPARLLDECCCLDPLPVVDQGLTLCDSVVIGGSLSDQCYLFHPCGTRWRPPGRAIPSVRACSRTDRPGRPARRVHGLPGCGAWRP